MLRVVVADPFWYIGGNTSSHDNVRLLVEFYSAEGLGEGITDVVGGSDRRHVYLIVCDPVLNREMFCVHVASPSGGLLSVGHVKSAGIIFKDNGWEIL